MREAKETPPVWRGKGRRASVLLGKHDREDARRLAWIARIFGPAVERWIVVVNLPTVDKFISVIVAFAVRVFRLVVVVKF